ncbi:MAG TPA: hypothetical protein PKZ16_02255 [bacterium]|nr:hypothetical protein [bacterium]HPL95570.1 hypothetical protein [bacterium]
MDRIIDIIDDFFTTVLNLVYGGFGALINQGVPEARRILRGFEWLTVTLILAGVYALINRDVPILSAVLLVVLLIYYGGIFFSSIKINIRDHEIGGWDGAQRTLSLLFMFFTPVVVLFLFDIDFATSKVGIGMMAGYFIIGVFFDAFGRFIGRVTNAPAYWLTIFMLTTLALVAWKSAFPENYLAHKVDWERKVGVWTAHKDRKSFPSGLDGSATYTKVTEETFCFYKCGGTFIPATADTTNREHLRIELGTEVAVVNHGTAPEMWGDEQMVLVRLKNSTTNLFTGKKVWVPSRFLDNFQSPLDYRPKPAPTPGSNTTTTTTNSPPRKDTTTISISNQGEWVEIGTPLHEGMRVYVHAPYKEVRGMFSWMEEEDSILLQPIYKHHAGGWWGFYRVTAEPDDPSTKFLIQVPEAVAGETVQYWIG